jgi:uncharacterized membrane protein
MIFAFFGIWYTALFAGAAAVSVPIIIHLLNRRRYKIVTWAAMRFLLNAQKQNTRRMRIEQLLLLLTRMTLVAFIVIAMAAVMPWAETLWAKVVPPGWVTSERRYEERVHHLFVLDASLSMNLRDGNRTLFERARQLATQKIESSAPSDGFSVLLLKDNPTWLVGEASQDRRKVLRELETARAGHGNASVLSALNMISAKLSETAQRFPTQAVYFFTDLQKSTWQFNVPASTDVDSDKRDPVADIKKRAAVAFVDVGKEDAGNLAVTDVSFAEPFVTSKREVDINASVTNFGAEPRRDVHMELHVGRAREQASDAPMTMRLVDEKVVSLVKPNAQERIGFKYRFPTQGTYVVQVKLQGADLLDVDDARAVVVTVKENIPVLLVNGKLAPDRFDTATEYLRLALNPLDETADRDYAPLRPRVVNQRYFAEMSEAELAKYECVFWCDVPQFGSADLRRIEAHVRRGGGLVVSMGEKAAENFDGYNRLLYKDEHGLLPAKLSKKIVAPGDLHFYVKAFDDVTSYQELPLRAFADENQKGSLNRVRFYQYVQATAAPQARVILQYQPERSETSKANAAEMPIGDPALIEWNPPLARGPVEAAKGKDGKRLTAPAYYRGKVVLLTSTFNTDWTNWPGSPSYLAMVQELTRLAASGRLREQAGVVGSVLEDSLPGGGAELDVTMHYPAAFSDVKPIKSRTQLVEDVNVFQFADTDYSGIYRVVVGATGQEIPFAVNFPLGSTEQRGSESDLTRLSADALKSMFPWNLQIVNDPSRVDLTVAPIPAHPVDVQNPVGPMIARYLLMAVFVLLFAEVIMAWRFGHYTTVEGVTAPATASVILPLTLAIIAIVVFGIGALALWWAVKNDDVLAVFPEFLLREGLRGWIEKILGKAPPPPGESSHWPPLLNAWLPDFLPGSQHWWSIGLFIAGGAMVVMTYLAEAPAVGKQYKLLLAGLRLCMLATTIWLLLPRSGMTFTNEVWPDVVILIDTTRSMGEPDAFRDPKVLDRAKKLGELVRKQVEESLPEKLKQLQADLEIAAKKKDADPTDNSARDDYEHFANKVRYWEKQREIIKSPKWQPTRLLLVQALFSQPENDWLQRMHIDHKRKLHIYQLDINGRAIKLTDEKGPAGEVVDSAAPSQLTRARDAIRRLEADGKESRLGTALQQVIDQYRGSSLAGVVMITDGVTTRDKTIGETAADYAAQKGIPLFLIGIGDDHEIRDLKLHDLQCDDTVFKGDRVNFEVRLTGEGFQDLTVPVVLKLKGKDGTEKEIERQNVKIDPKGKSVTVKVRLKHTPTDVGRKVYIVEVEPPKIEGNEKPMSPGNLRLERAVEVVEDKEIKVLYVEQLPRYEFRYVKFLLERESPNQKSKKKSITLNVVLLDAEEGFSEQDKTALPDFPATMEELNKYDVVIFGDCDPNHRKLGAQRLKNLASFVKGEDEKGRKLPKAGGGFLMIAGTTFSPHAYRNTPLADVLPIEPTVDRLPPEPDKRTEKLWPDLTKSGQVHPIFKFSNDDKENALIWAKLAPMYWSSSHYRAKQVAEVLAVHPHLKAEGKLNANQGDRLPLIVQQYVGSGRSMFFGFDETWRWRIREDEVRFNTFWVQTMRYLSRGRSNRTDLRLDKQRPYPVGEPITVTVRFPDGAAGPDGIRLSDSTDVKVVVEYRPPASDKDGGETEIKTLGLTKIPGSWGAYEAKVDHTREGKYRMRLLTPDVRKWQPDGESPSADAVVIPPPGEMDRLRMNANELTKAADATQGHFYTLATADQVVDDVPPGVTVKFSSNQPPLEFWNHAIVFCAIMLMLTAEWFLRKRKYLL